MNLRLFVSILITLFVAAVHAQNTAGIEIDSRKIPLPARRSQILESIQNITGVSFSYAANQFDNIVMAELPEGEMQLETLLQKIFFDYHLQVAVTSPGKWVLQIKEARISISGYVMDAQTGEVLPGVLIYQPATGNYTSTDVKGFYYMECRPGPLELEVRILGYEIMRYTDEVYKSIIRSFRLAVVTTNLPPVIIQEKQLLDPLSEIMPRRSGIEKNTVLGEADPLNILKTLPGVTPGSEGGMGIQVRGSGSDQNLVMMEGMPVYEAYHTGALSSIFMDDAVRTVDFMKSGQPARYGGRLNAVVNVLMKDGNRQKRESILHLGIQGMSFFTEGPLARKKLTYAFSLRTSWINEALKPIKKKITLYDDIFLQYRDVQLKLNYRWSETQKLSATYYRGNDRLKLSKDSRNLFGDVVASQSNQFSGSNELLSIQYDHVLNHQLKYNLQAGMINYKVFSRGTYKFPVSVSDSTTGTLDVINNSQVNDKQISGSIDYFVNDNVKVSAGSGYIVHTLNPAVKQSLAVVDGIAEGFGNPDSAYTAREHYIFIEGNVELGNRFYLIPGVYQVNYSQAKYGHHSWQPRLQMQYQPYEQWLMQFSYTRSAQYIILLANSGLGLPSELWVPSTQKVGPQFADHFAFDTKINLDSIHTVGIGLYRRNLQQLSEYSQLVDFFINIFPPKGSPPIVSTERDWENQVLKGTGATQGIELSVRADRKKWQYWLSYHKSSSTMTFAGLNEGLTFVSRFDRPLQINAGVLYKNDRGWRIGANWVYTSGQPFTLADEKVTFYSGLDTIGITLVQTGKKNNYRMPHFHQLTVNASYDFKVKDIKCTVSFGVFNAYNRLNSYFIYASRTDASSTIFKKVSLFPILPQLSMRMLW